ncbi:hypothetical protein R1sor_005275 [Riccia sorocarpa]|uniref:Myb/SANT-like DNA-binding domain-containing protein n=1 Tax=Riccia sorocarpa TaxID=122646 RepID=A0ABD3HQM2_9MARC
MAHERTWTDEENGTLIQAVSEEYLEQLSSPTSLRIWDLIAVNLQASGVQCTPLEAKVQWDSLAWGYLLIADHSDDCGATVYFDMTAEERTWSGLPPNFPKSWYDDIKAFYPRPLCDGVLICWTACLKGVECPFLSLKCAVMFMFKVVLSRDVIAV